MRAQMTVSDSNDDHVDTSTPRPPRGSGLYTATWAVLAVTATGYMAALLLEPEWAAPLTTQSLRAEEPSPATPELVEQLTGEVNSLRETIANLQRELTKVKAKAAAREVEVVNQQKRAEIDPPQAPGEQDPVTAELQQEEAEMPGEAAQIETAAVAERDDARLRATDSEPTHSDVSPDRPETVERPTDMPALAAAEGLQERQPPIEILAVKRAGAEDEPGAAQVELPEKAPALTPPPPAPVKKVAALGARPEVASAGQKAQKAAPVATASLPRKPPAIVFGPAIVTRASEAFAIRLETGPSLDALRSRWRVLSSLHRSALGDLEPRYLAVGTPGNPSYELLAGPITSLEEASRICALLRENMVPCSVGGQFDGEAL